MSISDSGRQFLVKPFIGTREVLSKRQSSLAMICLSYKDTTDVGRSDGGDWERETGAFHLEPGARVGLMPGAVETNPRDLAWNAPFAKVHVCVGTVLVLVLVLGSPAAHVDTDVAYPAPQRVRLQACCRLWLWQRRRDWDWDWGADGHRVASRLTARQLLAMMNLRAGGAAAWFPDGAAACNGAHCSLLTVNGYGRTVLEPAKAVENGFWLA
ncbi:hypothetical protein FIBSPDRAFT_1050573 [Athelia psychrophila]|uniref:Uncharacterized protein n=1 Tax=Athelia psychrophila TaxID=1759441 RepID=A0A166AIN3_9AGAM|nr:hypothetical protein FIBSPDRAFT_1050573 [Fibularhizoctonia sp. CBS 109695]